MHREEKTAMDSLLPASPIMYPFPCWECRGRFFCICESLEKAGFCFVCRTYPCSLTEPEWDDFIECNLCEGRFECICHLLETLPTPDAPSA